MTWKETRGASGADLRRVGVPAQRDPTRTHLNLDDLKLPAVGEVSQHLAVLLDHEFVAAGPPS